MPVPVILCTSTKCYKPVMLPPTLAPRVLSVGKEKNGCSALANQKMYVVHATEFDDRDVFECVKPKCLATITGYGIIEFVVSSSTSAKTAGSRC